MREKQYVNIPIFAIIGGLIISFLTLSVGRHLEPFLLIISLSLTTGGFLVLLVNHLEKKRTGALESLFHQEQKYTRDVVLSSISLTASGVHRYFENISKLLLDIDSVIDETRYTIDIAGISLDAFIKFERFKNAMINAAQKGVRFRVLLLDPKLPASEMPNHKHTMNHVNLSVTQLENEVKHWIKLQKNVPKKLLTVHLYKGMPTSFLLIADDILFFSPLLSSNMPYSPCFEVRRKPGPIYEAFKKHFEELWRSSYPVES